MGAFDMNDDEDNGPFGTDDQGNIAGYGANGGPADPQASPAIGVNMPWRYDPDDPVMSKIEGGLLDPRTFPVWLQRPSPQVTGPLDTDPHLEGWPGTFSATGSNAAVPPAWSYDPDDPLLSRIQGGLLDPRTFPAWLQSGARNVYQTLQRPSVQAMGPLDTDLHPDGSPEAFRIGGSTGVSVPWAYDPNDPTMSRIQGGLLDPRTFPVGAPDNNSGDYQNLQRPAPQITGALDRDMHAEPLQNIASPANSPPLPDNIMIINGQRYSVIAARTFKPALSQGQTIMPSPDVMAAAIKGAPTVAVPKGDTEKGGYIAEFPLAPTAADADPRTGLSPLRFAPMVFQPSSGIKPDTSDTAHLLHILAPFNAEALIHGHLDSEPSGFLDSTLDADGYGDTQSLALQNAIPTATVSHGQVGWHVLDRGQLKFIYPENAMTPHQAQKMQENIDQEQLKFQRKK